jgi:signal transduction histidine kinase/DNA-binding SARP family transcriptional activator
MEIRVLGPLEVLVAGRPVRLGGRRQRGVLAVLALRANETVGLGQLIDELWGDHAPASATNTVQTYISHLRRALEPGRQPGTPARVLAARPGGYMLCVDPDQIDCLRFERLLTEGRQALDSNRPRTAAELLRAALSLWRGPALADFAGEPLAALGGARLEELRLVALETRISADLALGAHAQLVAELRALVAAHPLREQLCAQLMLALYRSRRQTEALQVYRQIRAQLANELAVEPSAELQRLERAILQHHPDLDWHSPPDPSSSHPAAATPAVHAPARPAAGSVAGALIGRSEQLASRRSGADDIGASGSGRLKRVAKEPGIGVAQGTEHCGKCEIPACSYVEDYRAGGSWICLSPQAMSMFGYTEAVHAPNEWKSTLHPADRDRIIAEDERCERTLEPFRQNYRQTAGDGGTIWVRDEAVLVYDDTGEPRFWQGALFKLTDQTMAQLEATDRLAALDELKSTFLTTVTQELRTPLATILSASLAMERAPGRLSEESTADLLGRLASTARRLDRQLTDLIDLQRLDWSAISLARRPFDIAALLHRVAARWRSETLSPQVHAPSAIVRLDPHKVERIVDELLANAAMHTPHGTPVWVRAHRHNTGLRLAIEDAGPGVPSELRSQMFERFRHGYIDRSRTNGSGLGIGLSLVLRLAELHGGTAWVEDRSGGGSSFQVILPGPGY